MCADLAREKDDLTSHIMSALSCHPAVEGRTVAVYSRPVCYIVDFTSNPM